MLGWLFKNKVYVLLYLFAFFSIGTFYISFFPPDEPKYVDAALRMIESGNYIIPFFNCHVRFDKPILFYWELVAFFKIFGVEHMLRSGHDYLGLIEYAARLPSVIAASITAIYVNLLTFKLFKDTKKANFAILGFISIGFFIYLGRAVYPDMSLILFELMGVYYFIKARYLLGWLFTALAFLVKGPIGVVSVGFTYFLYLWVVEKSSGVKEFFSVKNELGFLIFLVVGMPWYIIVYNVYGMEFVNKFLIYHNIARFTGMAHQHPHSFFYYIPIVLAVVYIWWPYLYDLLKNLDFKDSRVKFLLLWFLWVFLFFSISRNKLPHYIAFGFIPLAVLFGVYFETFKNNTKKGILFAVFELILGLFTSSYVYSKGLIALVPMIFTAFLIVSLTNLLNTPGKVIFCKTITLVAVSFIVLLGLEGYRPEKFIWHEVVKDKLPLVQYSKFNESVNESIVAYTRQCITKVKDLETLKKKRGTFLVYTKQRYLRSLKLNYKVIGEFLDLNKGTKTVLIKVKNG